MITPVRKLKILTVDFEKLISRFRYGKERMVVAFGHRGGDTVILPPDGLIILDDACFDRQSAGFVKLNRNVNNQIHAIFAASHFNAYLHFHSHPFDNSQVDYSGTDDAADRDLYSYLNGPFLDNTCARSSGRLDVVAVITGVFGQHTAKFRTVVANGFGSIQIVTIGERVGLSGAGEEVFSAH